MRTVEWHRGRIRIINQNELPHRLSHTCLQTVDEVVDAIKTMKVRGAPALGVIAAFGLVLGVKNLKSAAHKLFYSRPTAVNIRWALDRMLPVAQAGKGLPRVKLQQLLLKEAELIAAEDLETNRSIGRHGAKLVRDGMTALTVCNAGALATVGYGTALGVFRAAHEEKKKFRVFAAETRPRLQGAKLTVWELQQAKIPVTLITDNMIGHFMQRGEIDLVVAGADRIARNGDTANKIGTYAAAVLAKEHGIPCYIAAPFSTVDLKTPHGRQIVIEERDPGEVTHLAGRSIAPKGTKARNPAFDVTPAGYITGIITERGIIKPSELAEVGKN